MELRTVFDNCYCLVMDEDNNQRTSSLADTSVRQLLQTSLVSPDNSEAELPSSSPVDISSRQLSQKFLVNPDAELSSSHTDKKDSGEPLFTLFVPKNLEKPV